MNKIYYALAFTLLSAQLFGLSDREKQKIQEAIEESSPQLKKLLRRFPVIEAKEKQELVEFAQDIVDEQEAKVGLLKSPWDLTKVITGVPLSALFSVLAIYFVRNITDKERVRDNPSKALKPNDQVGQGHNMELYMELSNEARAMPQFKRIWKTDNIMYSALFGLFGVASAYLAYRGYNCTTAQARVDKAQSALEEISKLPTPEELAKIEKEKAAAAA